MNRNRDRYPVVAGQERLQRLDRELMRERSKSHDYVFAVGRGLRIRVCVLRDEDGKFFATGHLGRAFRVEGSTPSTAYWRLTIAMRVHLAAMPSATREKVAELRKVSELRS